MENKMPVYKVKRIEVNNGVIQYEIKGPKEISVPVSKLEAVSLQGEVIIFSTQRLDFAIRMFDKEAARETYNKTTKQMEAQ